MSANSVEAPGGRAGVLGEVNPGFCLMCPQCGILFGPVVPTPEMTEMEPIQLAEKYFPELIHHEGFCKGRLATWSKEPEELKNHKLNKSKGNLSD